MVTFVSAHSSAAVDPTGRMQGMNLKIASAGLARRIGSRTVRSVTTIRIVPGATIVRTIVFWSTVGSPATPLVIFPTATYRCAVGDKRSESDTFVGAATAILGSTDAANR